MATPSDRELNGAFGHVRVNENQHFPFDSPQISNADPQQIPLALYDHIRTTNPSSYVAAPVDLQLCSVLPGCSGITNTHTTSQSQFAYPSDDTAEGIHFYRTEQTRRGPPPPYRVPTATATVATTVMTRPPVFQDTCTTTSTAIPLVSIGANLFKPPPLYTPRNSVTMPHVKIRPLNTPYSNLPPPYPTPSTTIAATYGVLRPRPEASSTSVNVSPGFAVYRSRPSELLRPPSLVPVAEPLSGPQVANMPEVQFGGLLAGSIVSTTTSTVATTVMTRPPVFQDTCTTTSTAIPLVSIGANLFKPPPLYTPRNSVTMPHVKIRPLNTPYSNLPPPYPTPSTTIAATYGVLRPRPEASSTSVNVSPGFAVYRSRPSELLRPPSLVPVAEPLSGPQVANMPEVQFGGLLAGSIVSTTTSTGSSSANPVTNQSEGSSGLNDTTAPLWDGSTSSVPAMRKRTRGRPKGSKNKKPRALPTCPESTSAQASTASPISSNQLDIPNTAENSNIQQLSRGTRKSRPKNNRRGKHVLVNRPVVAVADDITDGTAPLHPPGSLAIFMSVVKWARLHAVTESGFYTIPNSKIEKVVINNVGEMSLVCGKCNAKYFAKEKPQRGVYRKCCNDGAVIVPPVPAYPEELKNFFMGRDPNSSNFLNNIRHYNNGCAFAAFTHNSVALTGHGPKTYSVHGQSYHRIGSANPAPGETPRYSQLYILDSGTAMQAREDLPYYRVCNRDVFEKIDRIIREHNPVYKALLNMQECQKRLEDRTSTQGEENTQALQTSPTVVKMYIGNDKKMNIRQYAPPTTSDEISIVVPEDCSDKKPERYVTVFWKSGKLQHIYFGNPCLDTLIYPLFFVFGQYGYSINLFSWEENRGAPPQLRPQRVLPPTPPPGNNNTADNYHDSAQVSNMHLPTDNINASMHISTPLTESQRHGTVMDSHVDEIIEAVIAAGVRDVEDATPSTSFTVTNEHSVPIAAHNSIQGSECPYEEVDPCDLELDDDDEIIIPEVLRTKPKKVSQMNFYAHMVHVKAGNEDVNFNPIHHGRKLFQQYCCDAYVRVEEERLRYIRREQERLRRADYTELHQKVHNFSADNNVQVGQVVILPSSFTNGRRNMVNHYRDAMAIVGKFGKPDYFITFTCNPKWPEIQSNLFPGQTALDRPDLVARVFELKVKEFTDELETMHPLGNVVAYTYAIEHQKRGMPHLHLLAIMDSDSKPNNAAKADTVVSAEIPCREMHKELHEKVMRHMIHGPCGGENINSPCMSNGTCGKDYPKEFNNETVIDGATYPRYRRSDNKDNAIIVNNRHIHNGWVVPYNPFLLMKFDAHINVEICSSLRSVKYLYKYVHKGHDNVKVVCEESGHVHESTGARNHPLNHAVHEVISEDLVTQPRGTANIDEINDHIRARYISAPEAVGRLFAFKSTHSNHTVHRLPVHLPGNQSIMFEEGQEREVLAAQEGRHTQLTAWFELNKKDPSARSLRYTQIPTEYVWNAKNNKEPEKSFSWTTRKRNRGIISRMHNVPLRNMELFALRVLLLHVTGCQSFDDVKRLPDGTLPSTFLEAAIARGLIDDDKCWEETLEAAIAFQMPSALRNLFGMILSYGQVTDSLKLWEAYKEHFIEDFIRDYSVADAENLALMEIREVVVMNGRETTEFNLPIPGIVRGRLNVEAGFDPHEEAVAAEARILDLNPEQRAAVLRICQALHAQDDSFEIPELLLDPADATSTADKTIPEENEETLFYLDGPGGTGKTFVYNTLMSIVRSQKRSVLAVAPTGIAATLLPGGRTVHSRFGVPIDLQEHSTSSIKPGTKKAEDLKSAQIIIWDEISMTHKYVMSVVDRIMRHLMRNSLPFGGKVVVVGGDFRQQLPVVKGGGEHEIVVNSVVYNSRWREFRKLALTQNMRTHPTQREFAAWLLELGEGRIPRANPEFPEIELPDDLVLKKTENWDSMVDYIYGKKIYPHDAKLHIKKAILCPLNEDTFRVNADVLNRLEGPMVTYRSADVAVPLSGDPHDVQEEFPMELMNKTTPSGMPHHELNLKEGAIIMLLRNLNPKLGMVNGARMKVVDCKPNAKVIKAQFLTGLHSDKFVLIPRIKLCPTEHQTDLPIRLQRTQFPVRLAYSMTINKSQGQTLDSVGIILSMPVFSHGMLYTAFSRVTSKDNVRVQIGPELLNFPCRKTINVVYRDIFLRRDGR